MLNCLKDSNDFAGKTVFNVCDGTQTFVPYGSLDWTLGIGLIAAIVALVAFLVHVVRSA